MLFFPCKSWNCVNWVSTRIVQNLILRHHKTLFDQRKKKTNKSENVVMNEEKSASEALSLPYRSKLHETVPIYIDFVCTFPMLRCLTKSSEETKE